MSLLFQTESNADYTKAHFLYFAFEMVEIDLQY